MNHQRRHIIVYIYKVLWEINKLIFTVSKIHQITVIVHSTLHVAKKHLHRLSKSSEKEHLMRNINLKYDLWKNILYQEGWNGRGHFQAILFLSDDFCKKTVQYLDLKPKLFRFFFSKYHIEPKISFLSHIYDKRSARSKFGLWQVLRKCRSKQNYNKLNVPDFAP